MLLSLVRLWIGPSLPDRVLALDTLYINTMALLVLIGLWIQSAVYFEAALLIAMLGFISTIALSRYLAKGKVVA
ncbi:MAG: K+/H+ antiporter subunit F [Xanthomonadales bacterium]|nr:K+/H+ antiporter subunit F [Xanthomonadales bacterium]